jgi:hypothetical protein
MMSWYPWHVYLRRIHRNVWCLSRIYVYVEICWGAVITERVFATWKMLGAVVCRCLSMYVSWGINGGISRLLEVIDHVRQPVDGVMVHLCWLLAIVDRFNSSISKEE